MMASRSDLSKILFNHPGLDQEASRPEDGNYLFKSVLGKRIASTERISQIILPLLSRVTRLELSDFKAVGLEQEINQQE